MDLRIKVLDKEPKTNKLKQFAYLFTRPIAKLVNWLNTDYDLRTKLRQETIAEMNRRDFIHEAFVFYLDEHMAKYGNITSFEIYEYVDKAEKLFIEKKNNSGFDELNIMK